MTEVMVGNVMVSHFKITDRNFDGEYVNATKVIVSEDEKELARFKSNDAQVVTIKMVEIMRRQNISIRKEIIAEFSNGFAACGYDEDDHKLWLTEPHVDQYGVDIDSPYDRITEVSELSVSGLIKLLISKGHLCK